MSSEVFLLVPPYRLNRGQLLRISDDERAAAAQGIRDLLVDALCHDEYAVALEPRLDKLERDAVRLLAPTKLPQPAPPMRHTRRSTAMP